MEITKKPTRRVGFLHDQPDGLVMGVIMGVMGYAQGLADRVEK